MCVCAQDASEHLEAETEEEGLLNLVRRLSYERPVRPPKRARLSPRPPVPAKQVRAAQLPSSHAFSVGSSTL